MSFFFKIDGSNSRAMDNSINLGEDPNTIFSD